MLIFLILLLLVGLGIILITTSATVTIQPNQALVERLGKYHRTLKPGLAFIVPLLDKIVIERSMSEQVLDVKPQSMITKDSVSLTADAVVYWQILDLHKSYYSIDQVEGAIQSLVLTILRSKIGEMNLDQTFAARNEINRALLEELDEATGQWGVKIKRVEVQQLSPTKTLLESMELQRAAEIRKRAAISEAEGKAEAMRVLAKALNLQANSQEFLKFLIAQNYVDASQKLSSSANAKVIFMDPQSLNTSISRLLDDEEINLIEDKPQ